jgi:hypothetical protein
LDPDSLSYFPIRLKIWILQIVGEFVDITAGSDSLGVVRWPSKALEPLAIQIQEPKTTATPSFSMAVRVIDAIVLAEGSSMSTPT